jgi:hypothetical protein
MRQPKTYFDIFPVIAVPTDGNQPPSGSNFQTPNPTANSTPQPTFYLVIIVVVVTLAGSLLVIVRILWYKKIP